MDVRQIEYFVLAAKAGSFSAAAKSAFVTQQTLSASVASLEGEVKTPLFHRRRQGIELTDFGARFLPKCERVLEAVHAPYGHFCLRHRKLAGKRPRFHPGDPARVPCLLRRCGSAAVRVDE